MSNLQDGAKAIVKTSSSGRLREKKNIYIYIVTHSKNEIEDTGADKEAMDLVVAGARPPLLAGSLAGAADAHLGAG